MKKENRGFTLIELLAVIIILAIVMVIALPNVLDAWDNAQSKADQSQAQKLGSKAVEYLEAQKVMPDKATVEEGTVLSASDIGVPLSGGYSAAVVAASPSNYSNSTVYVTNGTYCILGVAAGKVSSATVSEEKCPTSITVKKGTMTVKCPKSTTWNATTNKCE